MTLAAMMAITVSAEPVIRVVRADGTNKTFATDEVRKLVLSSESVSLVDNAGEELLNILKNEIARVEFTDGTPDKPDTPTAVVTTSSQDKAVKIMENGQVYILHSGKKYTLMGVEVENNK